MNRGEKIGTQKETCNTDDTGSRTVSGAAGDRGDGSGKGGGGSNYGTRWEYH